MYLHIYIYIYSYTLMEPLIVSGTVQATVMGHNAVSILVEYHFNSVSILIQYCF